MYDPSAAFLMHSETHEATTTLTSFVHEPHAASVFDQLSCMADLPLTLHGARAARKHPPCCLVNINCHQLGGTEDRRFQPAAGEDVGERPRG
jgi:hypothetical protein